jgi:hypothetical protein
MAHKDEDIAKKNTLKAFDLDRKGKLYFYQINSDIQLIL